MIAWRRAAWLLCALHLPLAAAQERVLESAGAEAWVVTGQEERDDSAAFTQWSLAPEVEALVNADALFRFSARLDYDDDRYLDGSDPADGSFDIAEPQRFASGRGRAELRDLYLDIADHPWTLRLGRQQIVWGRLDGLYVLDQINPRSFREFILAEPEDARIGLWSARATFDARWGAIELVVTPDTTVHEIPAAGGAFAPTAPRFRFGSESSTPLPTDHAGRDQMSYGLRAVFERRGWNSELIAVSGLDPEPLGRLRAGGDQPTVELFNKRRDLLGASVERALGAVVLRVETSYEPDVALNVRADDGALSEVDVERWRAALALDWMGAEVFVNAQLFADAIRSPPQGLIRPARDRIVTLFWRWQSPYRGWTVKARAYRSIDEGDGLLRPEVDYRYNDVVRLSFGADLFYGDADGIFGQFDDLDRLSFKLLVSI